MTDDQAWAWDEADARVLAAISSGNNWLRSALCTLARRGVLLRQTQPERAAAIIAELSRWPIFKGGQFLFDLLEWEDFMVSGEPPAPISTVLGPRAIAAWSQQLQRLRGLLDDAEAADLSSLADLATSVSKSLAVGDLPELEPGLYLFHDVALGVFVSAATSGRLAGDAVSDILPSDGSGPATPPAGA